jgi:hypothetical protein
MLWKYHENLLLPRPENVICSDYVGFTNDVRRNLALLNQPELGFGFPDGAFRMNNGHIDSGRLGHYISILEEHLRAGTSNVHMLFELIQKESTVPITIQTFNAMEHQLEVNKRSLPISWFKVISRLKKLSSLNLVLPNSNGRAVNDRDECGFYKNSVPLPIALNRIENELLEFLKMYDKDYKGRPYLLLQAKFREMMRIGGEENFKFGEQINTYFENLRGDDIGLTFALKQSTRFVERLQKYCVRNYGVTGFLNGPYIHPEIGSICALYTPPTSGQVNRFMKDFNLPEAQHHLILPDDLQVD